VEKKVVIIGGGLGGLFCGAILAKEGLRVTVLEKNATIGGGLQTFTRFGETFDTGMHVVGGMRSGGNIWRICRYLGMADKVSVRDVDDDCTDRLYFAEDQHYYTIANGRERYVESLAKYFPHERENLRRYVDALFSLTEELDLFYLRPMRNNLFHHSEEFLMAADEFIAKYIEDKKLRSVVAYMNALYGGKGGQTPAYVHAVISVLYINGASRFVGGSSRFADLLADVIREHGGEVVTGDGVEWVEVNNRQVDYVRTRRGSQYQADWYISDIHPCTLLTLMDKRAFPKAFRDRMNEIPNSYSAFSLYIKMKENSFPYINHSEYYSLRYDTIWHFCHDEASWPMGFLLMTPPEENQGPWSRKVLVTAPMQFDLVKQWENTTVGRRGCDYEQWKRERTEELLSMVEELHSGFREAIEEVNASSPLTIRDFYGVKEGSICGFSKDCHNITLSQLPVVTKVSNLLLTGQNNNLHGFCGVPLTAINTCEAIWGMNYIINKINACDTHC
jgi:all-trans-retinol 13,14-reductase